MQVNLTRIQLVQLVEEYQKLRDWVTVKDFCNQVYGEGKVAQLEIETHGQYNDEGGTNYSVESIYATNVSEDEIDFDLSLPFWQTILKDQEVSDSIENDEDTALYTLKDWYPIGDDKAVAEANGWVQWDELPCDEDSSESYDLASSPRVNFVVTSN